VFINLLIPCEVTYNFNLFAAKFIFIFMNEDEDQSGVCCDAI
jgi:hypothetical protein